MDEVNAKLDLIAEREQHETFEAWLRLNQIPFIHSRMDRKPTIREGWPDFTLCYGVGPTVCIEFKAGDNEPTDRQWEVINELKRAKVPVWVCWSVEAAITVAKEALKLT